MTLRRISWASGIAVVLIGGFGLVRSRAQEEELDVLKVAPEYTKLLIDNAFVRVTEEVVPPGKGQAKHRHLRSVVVPLSDYEIEQKVYPNGQTAITRRRKGEVSWAEPAIHETRNIGTAVQDAVRIELK